MKIFHTKKSTLVAIRNYLGKVKKNTYKEITHKKNELKKGLQSSSKSCFLVGCNQLETKI